MGGRAGAGEGCAEERTDVCSWWTGERMVQRSDTDALSGNHRRRDYSIWEIAVTCYTSQPGVHLHNLAQSGQDHLSFLLEAAQQLFARRYVCRGFSAARTTHSRRVTHRQLIPWRSTPTRYRNPGRQSRIPCVHVHRTRGLVCPQTWPRPDDVRSRRPLARLCS